MYIYIPWASTTSLCLVFCRRLDFGTSTRLWHLQGPEVPLQLSIGSEGPPMIGVAMHVWSLGITNQLDIDNKHNSIMFYLVDVNPPPERTF